MLIKCPRCNKTNDYVFEYTNGKFLCDCGQVFYAGIDPAKTANTIPAISRKQLLGHFKTELDSILALMDYKNGNYGDGEDAFFNFRNTAMRVEGNTEPDSMYKMLMTYMDKHLCALAKNKMSDKEFIERHKDIIVYSLIAIAMKKEINKNNSEK